MTDYEQQFKEVVQLTRRLRRPEDRAYRLSYAGYQFVTYFTARPSPESAGGLDSLRAAVAAFDRLGRPVPTLLATVAGAFKVLKQPEARRAYFQAKAAQYKARGARENLSYCHFVLDGPFVRRGDYNQGISHFLRAADLASTYDRYYQVNHLMVAGYYYSEWGNPAKALHYLRQALAVWEPLPARDGFKNNSYTYRAMAAAYRQLRDYPAALRYANLSLVGVPADTTRSYAAGSSAGEREPTDLNRLCEEYLRLANQGLRAKDKSFNAALTTDFSLDMPPVTMVGADVGRVLLNLFTNALYAVRQRQQQGEPSYQPQVGLRTLVLNQQVQILVTDNGTGMSAAVQSKIFQPFFTTKPTGEGTGLGLSLSHDIIAQGNGGSLTVESQEGQGTAFTISLPSAIVPLQV
ncbi:ATP-binding protein [Hymenobacter arizonensis]|uniref:histidine kinase n=1 Tax=Hymenobacter arizonensis TaxID=1227077 RepID=A0A1I5U0K8_HYMAR|nr:ATP-binding protein [Hymenobacter arizonensis]SFP88799.1 Sel1 repeat-containing protein [Hymenobacter arizonensis]